MTGRRERKKKDKLKRIAMAARELFHSQGFDRTTTAQVAERAGVAEGTLFLYVAKKEDLLILAFTSEMVEVVCAASNQVDPNASYVDQMISFFRCLLEYHVSDHDLARAFLREVGFLRDPLRDYGFGDIPMMQSLAEIVDRAKTGGAVSPRFPSADIAFLAFSAYWLCLRDWANEAMSADEFVGRLTTMLQMQLYGLAT